MSDRFANRVAVVTGGARGIGRAVVEALRRDGAQASVWDSDPSEASDVEHAMAVDVTDAGAVERAASETIAKLGRIDILVNSAGITGPNATTWEYPVDAWRSVIDIDLTGTFLVCRAIVPHMRSAKYGRIINIASVAGKEGNPNASAYSAAKAGVIGLTKSLGKELAETAITVNCVTPAFAAL